VSRLIENRNAKNTPVINGISDGTSLLDYWSGIKDVIIIDAVCSGRDPGYLFRFDGLSDVIPDDIFMIYSTHSFSISETIKLGRTLGQLPEKLTIYGIEGKNFRAGTKLSAPVKLAADKLASKIIKYIEAPDYA